jgi:hypothetical protein
MKLFQKLLLAPAALGLMAPLALDVSRPASAADLNIAGVSQYGASADQVTSITQFSDVKPTDWAYQALSNLIERYGCVAGYPNGTFRGERAMTRWEAAALLNACLDRITEVTDELKRLMKEFEKELAVLKGRVDGLEAKVAELEATQFSTTTKLKGIATFVLGANSFGGSVSDIRNAAAASEGATVFNYDVRLNFDTSFTGKDLLRTTLRSGNFGSSPFGGGATVGTNNAALGLNQLEVAFQESDTANTVMINRLFYQFPVGDKVTVTVGGRVRQDDMLAMWPSVYPADTILDIFTYAGAPGAYNLNLGGGAGIWYQDNGWSFSVNYVAGNSQIGNPNEGGIGTSGSSETGTVQIGYAASNWGAAAVYNYSNGVGPASGTPLAVLGGSGLGDLFDSVNSVGLSAYWQPSKSGWVPSISVGWGINSYNQDDEALGFDGVTSQSWYVGLQWDDAFIKGNALGMAVGQPTFVTACGDFCRDGQESTYDAGYAWEWWYKFQVTDNISVTPAIFYLSNPLGAFGNAARVAADESGAALTNFGGVIKTTFKF